MPDSVDVTVFVPRGRVREGEILKSALMAVRDQIPAAAMRIKPVVVDASEPKTMDGTEGRDYRVTITWEPRRVGAQSPGDEPEPTVDNVLESLEPLTAEKLTAVTDKGSLA